MMQLIKEAWMGWQNYITDGKLPTLLLAVLLFYWFCLYKISAESDGVRKLSGPDASSEKNAGRIKDSHASSEKNAGRTMNPHASSEKNAGRTMNPHASSEKNATRTTRTLWVYTTIMTLCCICPVTAAVLMQYQTKFYDYQWIWNAVPFTIAIALGGTLIWDRYRIPGKTGRNIGLFAVLVIIILLSGSLGNKQTGTQAWGDGMQPENSTVLGQICKEQEETVLLWGPKDVMEIARSIDGSIMLVYGRNMWDQALSAYSYDTYGPEQEALYQWMCELEKSGEPMYPVETCVEYMKYMDVNTLVLPDTVTPELLAEMEQALGVAAGQAGGYYYFVL